MRITSDSPEADRTIVYLNGRLVRSYISAEDGDNGWVEVIDKGSIPPIDISKENEWSIEQDISEELEMIELKTKILKGKVEFKRLG